MATRGRPRTRPSVYDPSAVEALCNHLITGMGMTKACRKPECPSQVDVYKRLASGDVDFNNCIARARLDAKHAILDKIRDIADGATVENWQVKRFQAGVHQWHLARLEPKVYGPRAGLDPETDTSPVEIHGGLPD